MIWILQNSFVIFIWDVRLTSSDDLSYYLYLKIYYVQPRKQYDYLCLTVVAACNMSLASSITVPVGRLGGQTGAFGSRHFEQNTRAMALPVFLSLSLSLAIVAIQFTSLQSALGSGSGRLQGSTLLLRLYSESSPFTNHCY